MKEFIDRSLQNSFVESFGVFHQIETLVFRNIDKDYTMSLLDVVVESNINDFDNFSDVERILLIFLKLNLKTVLNYEISENNSLTLLFENYWIKFSSRNEYEFLQIAGDSKEKIELLILNSDGTFSLWD